MLFKNIYSRYQKKSIRVKYKKDNFITYLRKQHEKICTITFFIFSVISQ